MIHRQRALIAFLLLPLAGCETTGSHSSTDARGALRAAIAAEEPGDYFIGRRYFKKDYKFWGWVRRPQQPWSTAQIVMLNEQQKLAPDREQNDIGSDNNFEYKLYGDFSGQTVYEPASNGFYPEFVLKDIQLISVAPPNIYKSPGATDPARRIIAKPE
jgi:hypothetical protein